MRVLTAPNLKEPADMRIEVLPYGASSSAGNFATLEVDTDYRDPNLGSYSPKVRIVLSVEQAKEVLTWLWRALPAADRPIPR